MHTTKQYCWLKRLLLANEAATFQIDKQVRGCAELLEDTGLLAEVSAGDMVVLDAKYHSKCLVWLYNRARKAKSKEQGRSSEEEIASRIALHEGPSIKDQGEAMTSASLSIVQLLMFNSVKHERKQASAQSLIVRHGIDQETPVPTYIGLIMHAHMRKRDLVERLYHLGMSISYDRILRLSEQMGSITCKKFHQYHVVCPPKLKSKVFTSDAVDNNDHNPTSTTSKSALHGTGISLIQHPTFIGEGIDRSTYIVESSAVSKSVHDLPDFYIGVPLVTNSIKNCSIPATDLTSLKSDGFKQQIQKQVFVACSHKAGLGK